MIKIDIEIKQRNPIKEFSKNFHSRLENIAFSIIQRIPEKFIPHWLMNRINQYLDKRITELKQESIKMTWKNMYLQNAVDDIRSKNQDMKKAP